MADGFNKLEYKGYITYIHYSCGDKALYGVIENAENNLIMFESENIKDIEQNFQDAVDVYIEFLEDEKAGRL